MSFDVSEYESLDKVYKDSNLCPWCHESVLATLIESDDMTSAYCPECKFGYTIYDKVS